MIATFTFFFLHRAAPGQWLLMAMAYHCIKRRAARFRTAAPSKLHKSHANVANFVAFLDGYHMQLFALKFSESAELSTSQAFIRSLPRDQWSGQTLKHCKHMVLFAHVLEADFAHPHLRAKSALPPPLQIGVISLLKHQTHW